VTVHRAGPEDAAAIAELMGQLGYPAAPRRSPIAAAHDLARRWGCDRLEVSSGRRPERDAAHAFYLAAGFEETSPHSARYWKELEPPRPNR
jgi:hypothetical protein